MSNIIYYDYGNNQRSWTHLGFCKRGSKSGKEQFATGLGE